MRRSSFTWKPKIFSSGVKAPVNLKRGSFDVWSQTWIVQSWEQEIRNRDPLESFPVARHLIGEDEALLVVSAG